MSLNTVDFVNALIENNYTHLCVVPCSFAKNVINEVINNKNIEYLPAASEAVACSIAAGLTMAGKNPIVIVQSSGLTNMASCITSLLKPYGITFPIITSWRTFKEGDSEIQHQHLATELPKLISAYGYRYHILDSQNLNNAIAQINDCNHSHRPLPLMTRFRQTSPHGIYICVLSGIKKYIKRKPLLENEFLTSPRPRPPHVPS